MMPDRLGNNRCDSLRNIVRDPRVALLFLIPGSGSTLRINGRAHVSAELDLLASFKMEGKAPRTVIVMTVEEVYFQCARGRRCGDALISHRDLAADGVRPGGSPFLRI
jgi:predicted pyridoxine 5'-phosphate oxidase superfamily flavin-nucleotide-binding protein